MQVETMKILQGKIPLRLALTAPFVGLIVLAVGLVGYVSFCNGRRAVNDAADQVRGEISQRIQDRLHSFLNVPHQINQINADAIGRGLPDARDAKTLERSFWAQIQAFESVTSIYFGNTAGGLAGSGREPATDSQYVLASPGFAGGPLQKYAVDAQGNRTTLLATVPNFDARTRPWYINAVEKRGPVWSPIYILSTGQDMAIAASRPVYAPDRTLLGVVSVDIFLSHIGEFLRGLKVGQNGQCFIMERSGLLIASSIDGKPFTDDAGSAPRRRLQASESQAPVIRLAAAALIERFPDYHRIATVQQAEFESDGIRYFLEVSPVQDARGLDWLACVVICEADFMSRIEAGNRQTLLLIAGALLLTLIIGLAGAKRITRPISGLHSAAQGLAKGQWPEATGFDSSIREVTGLNLSFEEMALQLRNTIESLEREVEVSTKAQAALRGSEEKYRTLFENAPIGIAVVDREGNLLDANDAMFRLHGLRREGRMVSITTCDYYQNAGDREKTRARLARDGFLKEWEVRFKKVDGTPYDALLTMRPVEIGGNSVWLALIQDITEKRRHEQELEASVREKDLLLREVHHRVKNNMQIIASLLRLQTLKAATPEVVEFMEDCQSRIRAMALVHETLYHSEGLSHIRLLEYLRSLTGTVVQTYLHSSQIAVRVSVIPPDMILQPDKAIPFGLVVSELLTNALKYAFPQGRSGTVWINALQIDDRQLEVTVSDDGVGLPEDLDVHKTDTLGLELVMGLVEKQLEGAIEWRIENGTTFTIRFVP